MEPVVEHHSQQDPVFSSICWSLAMSARSLVLGSGLPGPFNNLGDGALWYPCNGSNLQLGAPFTGQADYRLHYCRCNRTRHVMVCVHQTERLRFKKHLPQLKPYSFQVHKETNTCKAQTGQRKAFTMHFCGEIGGGGGGGGNEHRYQRGGLETAVEQIIPFHWPLVYMHQWIGSALVQIMTWRQVII